MTLYSFYIFHPLLASVLDKKMEVSEKRETCPFLRRRSKLFSFFAKRIGSRVDMNVLRWFSHVEDE